MSILPIYTINTILIKLPDTDEIFLKLIQKNKGMRRAKIILKNKNEMRIIILPYFKIRQRK